jgi:hypothetical protein
MQDKQVVRVSGIITATRPDGVELDGTWYAYAPQALGFGTLPGYPAVGHRHTLDLTPDGRIDNLRITEYPGDGRTRPRQGRLW